MADHDYDKNRESHQTDGNTTESNPYNEQDQNRRESDRAREAQPGQSGDDAQDDEMDEDMEEDDMDMDDDLDSESGSTPSQR